MQATPIQTIQATDLSMDFLSVLNAVKHHGQHYVVEYGETHEKIAMLVPYSPLNDEKKERTFGIGKGKGGFKIHDDFEMTEEELLGYE